MNKPITLLPLEGRHTVEMNITPGVKKTHTALSKYNIKFLEYAKENPRYLKRSQFDEIIKWGHPEFDAAWGVMTFGYRYGDVLLRVLPRKKSKGVINVHQGAEASVVFEVEE